MNLQISNPDETNKNKETVLIQLCKIDYTKCTKSLCDIIYNGILSLIESKANLDLQDEDGNTSLIWACCYNHTKLINLLIEKGVNLDLQNKYGNTALMEACYDNNIEIISYILEFVF